MRRPVNVPVRAHARKARIDTACHERTRLIEHARGDHLANAALDSGDEDVARWAQSDPEGGDRRPADARHGTPRDRGDLQIAHETATVPRINTGCGIGVDRTKPLVERRVILGLQARAKLRVVRH